MKKEQHSEVLHCDMLREDRKHSQVGEDILLWAGEWNQYLMVPLQERWGQEDSMCLQYFPLLMVRRDLLRWNWTVLLWMEAASKSLGVKYPQDTAAVVLTLGWGSSSVPTTRSPMLSAPTLALLASTLTLDGVEGMGGGYWPGLQTYSRSFYKPQL